MPVARIAVLACACVLPLIAADDPPQDSKPADPLAEARERMVQRHLIERGIKDERVLQAFRTVPRHEFVPEASAHLAYEDSAIAIGEAQTITPPFDVAFMTEALAPKPTDKILEIGSGSGYQGSILAQLAGEVYTIEIHEPLAKLAASRFARLGYTNVHSRAGDGFLGWPEAAPFDGIIVTCAPKDIPRPLVDQLKEGGRMVIPIGQRYLQKLYVLEKKDGKMVGRARGGTLFVPMTGKAQQEQGELPQPAPSP
jgi:protein-L-isoaspartate(D-aspartate) O-methyltransferase